MSIKTAEHIIDFWFSAAVQPMWFNATAAFDTELREEYLRRIRRHLMVSWTIGQIPQKARWLW